MMCLDVSSLRQISAKAVHRVLCGGHALAMLCDVYGRQRTFGEDARFYIALSWFAVYVVYLAVAEHWLLQREGRRDGAGAKAWGHRVWQGMGLLLILGFQPATWTEVEDGQRWRSEAVLLGYLGVCVYLMGIIRVVPVALRRLEAASVVGLPGAPRDGNVNSSNLDINSEVPSQIEEKVPALHENSRYRIERPNVGQHAVFAIGAHVVISVTLLAIEESRGSGEWLNSAELHIVGCLFIAVATLWMELVHDDRGRLDVIADLLRDASMNLRHNQPVAGQYHIASGLTGEVKALRDLLTVVEMLRPHISDTVFEYAEFAGNGNDVFDVGHLRISVNDLESESVGYHQPSPSSQGTFTPAGGGEQSGTGGNTMTVTPTQTSPTPGPSQSSNQAPNLEGSGGPGPKNPLVPVQAGSSPVIPQLTQSSRSPSGGAWASNGAAQQLPSPVAQSLQGNAAPGGSRGSLTSTMLTHAGDKHFSPLIGQNSDDRRFRPVSSSPNSEVGTSTDMYIPKRLGKDSMLPPPHPNSGRPTGTTPRHGLASSRHSDNASRFPPVSSPAKPGSATGSHGGLHRGASAFTLTSDQPAAPVFKQQVSSVFSVQPAAITLVACQVPRSPDHTKLYLLQQFITAVSRSARLFNGTILSAFNGRAYLLWKGVSPEVGAMTACRAALHLKQLFPRLVVWVSQTKTYAGHVRAEGQGLTEQRAMFVLAGNIITQAEMYLKLCYRLRVHVGMTAEVERYVGRELGFYSIPFDQVSTRVDNKIVTIYELLPFNTLCTNTHLALFNEAFKCTTHKMRVELLLTVARSCLCRVVLNHCWRLLEISGQRRDLVRRFGRDPFHSVEPNSFVPGRNYRLAVERAVTIRNTTSRDDFARLPSIGDLYAADDETQCESETQSVRGRNMAYSDVASDAQSEYYDDRMTSMFPPPASECSSFGGVRDNDLASNVPHGENIEKQLDPDLGHVDAFNNGSERRQQIYSTVSVPPAANPSSASSLPLQPLEHPERRPLTAGDKPMGRLRQYEPHILSPA